MVFTDISVFCPICYTDVVTPFVTECGHKFCRECILSWGDKNKTCPYCRAEIVLPVRVPKHGDFWFIKDSLFRESLEWDYQVMIENDLWESFKKRDDDKPFIYDELVTCYAWYLGHSGASWCISMRNMEYIAKHGWEAYVKSKIIT